jgi:hypothetical protein
MRITQSATTNDKIPLRRLTMSSVKISDLSETIDLDRMAMAEVRGGWFGFAFVPSSSSSDKYIKPVGIDGESTDDKHGKW